VHIEGKKGRQEKTQGKHWAAFPSVCSSHTKLQVKVKHFHANAFVYHGISPTFAHILAENPARVRVLRQKFSLRTLAAKSKQNQTERSKANQY